MFVGTSKTFLQKFVYRCPPYKINQFFSDVKERIVDT
jgi:hypothetical protein